MRDRFSPDREAFDQTVFPDVPAIAVHKPYPPTEAAHRFRWVLQCALKRGYYAGLRGL
jgi:hypothetical protein